MNCCVCEEYFPDNPGETLPTCAEHSFPESAGIKHDQDKPRMDLLPMDALLEVAKVLTFGANKYGDRNWEKGIDLQRLRAAIMRHDAQTEMGNEIDEESGLLHRAHKACDCLMELALYLRKEESWKNKDLPF